MLTAFELWTVYEMNEDSEHENELRALNSLSTTCTSLQQTINIINDSKQKMSVAIFESNKLIESIERKIENSSAFGKHTLHATIVTNE